MLLNTTHDCSDPVQCKPSLLIVLDGFEVRLTADGAYAQNKPLIVPGTVDKLVISKMAEHTTVKGLGGNSLLTFDAECYRYK